MTSTRAKRSEYDHNVSSTAAPAADVAPGRQSLSSLETTDAAVGAEASYMDDPTGGSLPTQILDVNSYQDRMTMLTMISAMHPSPAGMPNPADGIPIQTNWQQSSGRDQMQWWSNVNFSLSVSQFLALQAQGEFPNVVLVGTPPILLSATVYALAQDYWGYQAYVNHQWPTASAGEQLMMSEILQQKMWEFHTAAIHEALNDPSTVAAMNQMYNDPNTSDEAQFADAWGNYMVDLLAAVNFPLDQLPINFFNNNALPQQVLKPGDLDPATTSLAPAELATVLSGIAFADFERSHNRAITRAAHLIARVGGPALTEARRLIAEAMEFGADAAGYLWSTIVDLLRRLPFLGASDDVTQEATALEAEVNGGAIAA